MKLELKHLSAYLPYDLQVIRVLSPIKNEKNIMTGITEKGIFYNQYNHTPYNHIKPILRPIKDVETFKYKPRYGKEITISQILTIENMENLLLENIDEIPYAIIEILFKYHFDVFGLISKNLAVAINRL